jgi:hypothetical protein
MFLSARIAQGVLKAATKKNGGDSIYFDSSVMHSYRRAGRRRCTAIVVTAG